MSRKLSLKEAHPKQDPQTQPSPYELVDSHAHLSFEKLGAYGPATAEALKRAKGQGVAACLDIILHEKLLPQALAFSGGNPHLYHAFGVHPSNIEEGTATIKSSAELTGILRSSDKIIALGETGLDYFRGSQQKSQQIQSFHHHCEAAITSKVPVIIHMRAATQDTYHVVKEMVSRSSNFKAVMHCFSEDQATAKLFLDLGLFISFSGNVTFKNASDLKESAQYVPLDRLLVETDCPYLAPHPFRGKVNEPALTYYTAQYIANLKGVSLAQVANCSTANFKNLFKVSW